MRKVFLAALTVAALAFSGGAFAQSHQGGYLGLNPAGNQVAAAPAPSDVGSHQGGYLGENAGSKLAPARAADADMKASPMAWCANAMDPGRCRSRAEPDHAYCLQHNPDNYANCRRTMDFIGWHN
jgi:hypothetical protein